MRPQQRHQPLLRRPLHLRLRPQLGEVKLRDRQQLRRLRQKGVSSGEGGGSERERRLMLGLRLTRAKAACSQAAIFQKKRGSDSAARQQHGGIAGIALERRGSLLSAAPLRPAAERTQRTGGSLSGRIGLGETGDCGTPALRGDSGGCR